MIDYEFEFLLPDVSNVDATFMDRLYEAGCDDATLSIRCGKAHLIFTRSAHSLDDAMKSAQQDLRRAGIGFTACD